MKVLITGNMGYVGPAVVAHLRREHPDWTIDGFDSGYFAHCLTGAVDCPSGSSTVKCSATFASSLLTARRL